uniref:Cold-regulated protein 1 n=1 Tax=Chlorella vulgaris TaxID=3077 RepID=G0YUY2_CHLVU|nr:cold-regulated protein 1 [Chlorella vulgaris]
MQKVKEVAAKMGVGHNDEGYPNQQGEHSLRAGHSNDQVLHGQQGVLGTEQGVIGTEHFTKTEDRPVVKEHVELIQEHRPVEKEFVVETRATGVEREIPGGDVEHLGNTEREFSLNQHANTAQYDKGLQGTGVQSSAAQGTGPLGTGLQGKGLDGTTPY